MRPRVREVLKSYNKGGILAVKEYFNQDSMTVDPSTWSNNINNLIINNNLVYASTQIELLLEEFKL